MSLTISPTPWFNGMDANGKILVFEDERSPCETETSRIQRNNRRLLDAAPDLYDELKDVLRTCRKDFDAGEAGDRQFEAAYQDALWALAKARGEA